jgi:hypothetical protein
MGRTDVTDACRNRGETCPSVWKALRWGVANPGYEVAHGQMERNES